MIKANEIRIGNYFFDADGNEKKIDYSDLVSLEITCLHFNPIPLTHEILERFGFEVEVIEAPGIEIWNQYSKGKLTISEHLDHYVFVITDNGTVRLNYLHELQNFYYDLNKKELEINLNSIKSPA